METRPVTNKLAIASLGLSVLGWSFYILQWCFDLTIGLLLAVFTAGSSAVCATVLDFLPFIFWVTGILTGHLAIREIKNTGAPGRNRAVWGFVLGYLGIFFSIIFIALVIFLVASGMGGGILEKVLPGLPGK
jgi:hypothetical protein